MKKISQNILAALLALCLMNVSSVAEDGLSIPDNNLYDTELNVFGGMFDFSDHKQAAVLVGLQHQDIDLWRDSKIGRLSPITGGFITANGAIYLYSGVQAEYEVGFLKITPSFAPGYYNPSAKGKDLGFPLEFKSEVQLSFDLSKSTH